MVTVSNGKKMYIQLMQKTIKNISFPCLTNHSGDKDCRLCVVVVHECDTKMPSQTFFLHYIIVYIVIQIVLSG